MSHIQQTYKQYGQLLTDQINNIIEHINNISKNKPKKDTELQKSENTNVDPEDDASSDDSEEEYKQYKLRDVCEFVKIGTNIDDTSKDNKKYKVPYYGSSGVSYCKKHIFDGPSILCVRTEKNQGKLYKADGNFNASGSIIVLKLKNEYCDKIDDIMKCIEEDFNFKELIEKSPVMKDGCKVPSKSIGCVHLKQFDVKLKD